MNPNKRRDVSPATPAAKRPRKPCSYGENCYRRNPAHLREFSHAHLDSILDNYTGVGECPIPEHLTMQRQVIEEQLQIMIEKNIRTPGIADSSFATPQKQTYDASTNKNKPGLTDSCVASSPKLNYDASTNKNKPGLTDSSVASSPKLNYDASTNKNKPGLTDSSVASSPKLNYDASTNKNNDLKVTSAEKLTQAALNKNTGMDKNDGSASSVASKMNVSSENVIKKTAYVKPMDIETLGKKFQPSNNQASNASGSSTGNSDYRPIVQPIKRIEDFVNVVLPKGRMAEKHRKASPYYIFYTAITASKETHTQSNSITFQELLDPSLGELKCSLQINFMVEISWLLAQYYFAGYSQKRMTILYGEDMPDIKTISQKQKHIDTHMVNMGSPFGKHHTKLMLLCYENGSMRVVVSTANLYLDDWENRVQGLWLSPSCPELAESAMPHEGESETGFKKSLLSYLNHYALPCLTPYIERVRRCDFSYVNVFLVASVPGGHSDLNWGMCRVGTLLRQHCRLSKEDRHKWELIAQSSSIGSYGKEPGLWLTGDFQNKFCQAQSEVGLLPSAPPRLRLIYPSLENVQQSHDGLLGGGCLPYAGSSHIKQMWLKDFLHQWKAKSSHRDRAMPHIKSYIRVSPDYKRAAFYLLTSANVSKAAWGTITKGKRDLRIMSYEAGVLFLPRFVLNKESFALDKREDDYLPLAYDLPPTPYTRDMSPWVQDYLHD